MNKMAGFCIPIVLSVVFFSGCSSSTGLVVDANTYKGKQRCIALDKDLIKVDQYIELVTNTDAFHLEEAAVAMEEPDITTSTNKRQMLKDANNLKSSLEAERKKLACQ